MQPFSQEMFEKPPATLRSVPFWSLNDILEPAELARQLGEFKRGGFGGAYLHSRIGLLTEYLGEDWWKAMDAGVKACRELGLEAWFYDEDKWPSGFAGGIVPRADESFRARLLARVDKAVPIPPGCAELSSDADYRYLEHVLPLGDPWFNGSSWVDLFNPAMVDAFIDCSYRPYVERYARDAGTVAFGIFTDEPQISPRGTNFPARGTVAWSPHLRGLFKADYGYDVVDHLPSLFEEVGDWRRVRLHFYRSVGRCLEQSFSRRIGNYCSGHGFVWTGHYNGEGDFQSVIRNVGNMMIQYRHQQRPGIDWLGLSIAGGLHTTKSLSSVANQYGQERRLSEMFGCSGQNMSFEDRAWIADWHALLGVNHICPHLTLYSMKGCRKRDYPPAISPQQPWWRYNSLVEDRMARVSHAVTAGEYAPELLVIHPLESAMSEFAPQGRDRFYRPFDSLLRALMAAHRDFDLGDEQILADTGSVDGALLAVGRMRYPLVLLPSMLTIRETTVRLLLDFAANGGIVVSSGDLPSVVDAGPSDLAAALAAIAVKIAPDRLEAELAAIQPPAVTVTGEHASAVYTQRRTSGCGSIVVATNLSRKVTADISLRISGLSRAAVYWDVSSGKPLSLPAQPDGSHLIRLAPAGTAVITDRTAAGQLQGEYSVLRRERDVVCLDSTFKGTRLDPNALTLDFARFRKGAGAWSSPEPVLGIYQRLGAEGYKGPLSLSFGFEVEIVPAKASLVMEQPWMYSSIHVNGAGVSFLPDSTWLDFAFRKTDVGGYLKTGLNTVEMELEFIAPVPDSTDAVIRYGTEIESIYLAGEFGVTSVRAPGADLPTQRNTAGLLPERPIHRFERFRIGAETTMLPGNITPAGYPFYAGRFKFDAGFTVQCVKPDERYFIVFDSIEAQVAVVTLNGTALPPVAWSPWEVEITGILGEGSNDISIEITGSLRNLLGPHHHRDGELIMVGPESFTGLTTWTGGGPGDADWYDKRITGSAKIWRDEYHCIPFGFLSAPRIVARK